MRRFIRILGNQKGAVTVEMGFFMLIFSFLIIGAIDYATVAESSAELSNALRAGEQFALSQPGNSNGITDTIKSGSTLPPGDISASTNVFCECNRQIAICSSTCPGTMSMYVSMSASSRIPLLFTYPGVANPFPVNKTIAVRVQ